MNDAKYQTREQWLAAAVDALRPLFRGLGHEIPAVKVSTGWPSHRALSKKKKVLGECWDKKCAADQAAQIFISPILEVPVCAEGRQAVLDVLVHELIHAVFGYEEAHGKKFGQLARGLGLEGKLTATHPGEALRERLAQVANVLGAFPHASLHPLEKEKKQSTRMIKMECPSCGYTCRTTRKWLDIGTPSCPVTGHGPLKVELPEPAEESVP